MFFSSVEMLLVSSNAMSLATSVKNTVGSKICINNKALLQLRKKKLKHIPPFPFLNYCNSSAFQNQTAVNCLS